MLPSEHQNWELSSTPGFYPCLSPHDEASQSGHIGHSEIWLSAHGGPKCIAWMGWIELHIFWVQLRTQLSWGSWLTYVQLWKPTWAPYKASLGPMVCPGHPQTWGWLLPTTLEEGLMGSGYSSGCPGWPHSHSRDLPAPWELPLFWGREGCCPAVGSQAGCRGAQIRVWGWVPSPVLCFTHNMSWGSLFPLLRVSFLICTRGIWTGPGLLTL